MMKEICFYEIKPKSTIVLLVMDEVLNKKSEVWEDEYEWQALKISDEVLMQDTFLRKLKEKCNFVGHVFKIGSNQFYDWHTDALRATSINIVLNKCHCHTLFSKKDKYLCDFIELKYEPNTYYVLNTIIDHAVINFDETRYLLSLSFEKEMNYVNLVKEIMGIEQKWL